MPQLLPPIRYRVVGDDNLPLVGGKIYTYASGTTTPKATYTTFGMGAANTNPIILDANGEATIWLDGAYKIRITDEDDNILAEEDNVRDLTTSQTFTNATLAGTLTISGGTITWAANNTHSGNHTFAENVTVQGNTTIGNASSDTLTINPNAISYPNNPTHANNHTYSGTLTTSAAAPVFTFGATFGNTERVGATTLDWYEEDAGTTQLTVFGTGTAGTGTYSSRTLRWQREGNTVHFRGYVSWTAHTGTGSIGISGLPYTPADTCSITVVSENLTFSGQLVALINTLSPQIGLYSMTTGAALSGVAMDAAASIYISGSFRV